MFKEADLPRTRTASTSRGNIEMIIKAGYRLSVTSWENDADNHKTETIDGLTLQQVRLLIELVSLFDSGSEFSNLHSPSKAKMEKIDLELSKFQKLGSVTTIKEHWLARLGIYFATEFYTRVYEKHSVEHVPKEIVIEDATENLNEIASLEKIKPHEVNFEELVKIGKIDVILNGTTGQVHKFSIPISIEFDGKEFKHLPFQYEHKFEKETPIKSIEYWLGEYIISLAHLNYELCEKISLVSCSPNEPGAVKLSIL